MNFFSGIVNFGSKIFGSIRKVAQQVASALHKVLSTIAGPVGMIHPGIECALGAGANLADIQQLENSANGDFAFSAESGTVCMYDADWYNSGFIVPDQVTPASDATPLSDGTATTGISTEYSRGDHVYPLNVATPFPPSDSAINGVGNNGTSAFYARNDHAHPQQLTYDGNVTATKFIKAEELTSEVLCANGDTKAIFDIDSDSVKKTGQSEQQISGKLKQIDSSESFDSDYLLRKELNNNYVTIAIDQTITCIKTFNQFKKTNCTNQQILLADGSTTPLVFAQREFILQELYNTLSNENAATLSMVLFADALFYFNCMIQLVASASGLLFDIKSSNEPPIPFQKLMNYKILYLCLLQAVCQLQAELLMAQLLSPPNRALSWWAISSLLFSCDHLRLARILIFPQELGQLVRSGKQATNAVPPNQEL
ncbi:MAG: hypothetical protein EZS28_003124 [Streblomastix strix]|uniref:Uncharacterized protein n=1 Tax=Streblomastix strix TaxID=222440 RepID=A0A5J4X2E6_9EUKA|nr:MAG: hypothetical protein EZS28_003124 [Streblomastix strix]